MWGECPLPWLGSWSDGSQKKPLEGVVGTPRLLVPEKEADLRTETEMRARTWQRVCP